ncbi:MAG: amidase family protein [Dongiaceae bacterium]
MAGFAEYAEHDGLGLADLVRRGETTPRELFDAAMAALERIQPGINAIACTMEGEAERALRDVAPGGPLADAPFAGVPFLAKDLVISYAGLPTSCGSRLTHGFTRPFDSELVARFRRAGLVTIAKTTTPELGLCASTESVLHGATRNPWHLGRAAGGSSGGSAASVAAGIAPIGHANDGGGSIRLPASCCGLVGLKPTRGRNPLGPDQGEMWAGLVAEHVVTRSVRDSAAMLDCCAGPAPGDPYQAPAGAQPFLAALEREPPPLRVAVMVETFAGDAVDPACRQAVLDTAALLEQLGHGVDRAAPRFDVAAYARAHAVILAAYLASFVDDVAAELGRTPGPDNLEPMTRWAVEEGRRLTAGDLVRAEAAVNAVSRQVAPFFAEWDILLTPTLASPPVPIGHLFGGEDGAELRRRTLAFAPFTHLFNGTGQPAISLPAGWDPDGLPIGVQLVAGYAEDALLLQLAAQLEGARPWRHRRPVLH